MFAGYKTYITAGALVAYAIAGAYLGYHNYAHAFELMSAGGGLGFLRAAVSKIG